MTREAAVKLPKEQALCYLGGMRYLRPLFVILAGLALVIVGFIYDMVFAGLPYQDPPPAVQSAWLFHKAIAEKVILFGLLAFVVGLTWGLLSLLRRAIRSR